MLMSKDRDSETGLPERWSANAKVEVVLRWLRGKGVDAVSREIQVSAHELETWRRDFLERGVAGRGARDPEERELKQMQAKMGELAMKLELAGMLLEKWDIRTS
jgi:transposase-like protein